MSVCAFVRATRYTLNTKQVYNHYITVHEDNKPLGLVLARIHGALVRKRVMNYLGHIFEILSSCWHLDLMQMC